ncbi:MAG: hypothetical protein CL569_09470 [Alphaproteobacteria bacterium]|nr:hypothetical protein [Alphaproteobacteria bacterium]
MNSRFWVVGGEYTDTSFDHLVTGSERVMGPYSDRDAALIAWRQVAEETRGNCYARYTVAQEPGR